MSKPECRKNDEARMTEAAGKPARFATSANRLRFRRIAAPFLVAILTLGGCAEHATPPPRVDNKAPISTTITLIIDYGDGAKKHLTGIPWREKMTVLDVMEATRDRPHGITFTHHGAGEMAMLTQLDDLKNEERGAKSNNWTYRINDKLADRSFGLAEVKPGDVVLWKFGRLE